MMINKRLINICKDSKKYVALTTIVSLFGTLSNIIMIFFIGEFINQVLKLGTLINLNSSTISTILEIKLWNKISVKLTLLLIFSLLVFRIINNFLYGKFSSKASGNARLVLRDLLYKKLLKLGPTYQEVEETSAVIQVSVEGIEQLEVYFGRYLPQLFYSLLVPITLFIFMSSISLKVATIFILAVPLIPLSIISIMKFAKKILGTYWKSYSDLGGTFLENLQGLTTLKLFDIDQFKHEKMNKEAENFRVITMKVLRMQLNSITLMDLVAFLGAAIGTIFALIEFKNGLISAGDLLIIILLSSEFFIPLRLLGSYFHIAMNGMAASDRIFRLLDAKEEGKKKYCKIINKNLHIKFDNLSFSYDGQREILKNINMDFEGRGLTAIVGESGSGKSTIASLLMNNFNSYKGSLTINNMDIKEISKSAIYEKIGLVSTNSYIFTGTILDNLLLGKKNATLEEIDEALELASLKEFVDNLKNGLLTDVGESASSLSGGQKQRLALAREILANKDIIIFDEATSNIDVESEEKIWNSIYKLSEKKMIIVISHRLANIKNAKKIYVIDQGKLIEKGTDKELLANKNHYFNMINIQNNLEFAEVTL